MFSTNSEAPVQRVLGFANPRAHQVAFVMKVKILEPKQSHCRKPQYHPSDLFKKNRSKVQR